MNTLSKLFPLLIMAMALFGTAAAQTAPAGRLIYCSYSETGVAGLGKSYCELIADPGSGPEVHVVLDHDCFYAEERSSTTKVGTDVVEKLQQALADARVYELNGYYVDEDMTGGTIYRIYMEYDSGDKVNARWYGHGIKPEAWAAYHLILNYFEPWRSKLEAAGGPQ
ncbi:MAG: hypothetical protein IK031_06875 [Bacteroidales bacterium]|nr:hypothetical protein [Bacteroidales bacterium]